MPSDNTPSTIVPDAAGSAGTGADTSRDDHTHAISTGVPVAIGDANQEGTSTAFARADHVHDRGSILVQEGTVELGVLILGSGTQTVFRDILNNALTTVSANASFMTLEVETDYPDPPPDPLPPNLACVYSGVVRDDDEHDPALPFISSAANGQILVIKNAHTSAVQFNTGVAGSGVRLSLGATLTLTTNDYVVFIFNSTTSTWDQLTTKMTL
jgi:hypothetical protein